LPGYQKVKLPGATFNPQDLFHARKNYGRDYDIDIGTAGSISLSFSVSCGARCMHLGTMRIKIYWRHRCPVVPSIDYMRFVTLEALRRMGYECDIKLITRGYYPRGGGCVESNY